MKKKVLIVTNIPAPYRVDLYYYMNNNVEDYDFYVLYTNENEDNRQWGIDEYKMINSRVLKSKIIKVKGRFDTRYIHIPGRISKELKNIMPDVVIAFEYNIAALKSLLWCKTHKKKFIHLTDGTLNSERKLNIIQKMSRKLIVKYSNAYIASSTKAKEKLIYWKAKEEKIFISLLTVDINQYINNDRKNVENNILYVGSMVERKGLDLLINALPYIKTQYKLRIVGNGTEEQQMELKKLIKSLDVTDKVEICGFKTGKQLQEEYSSASVFVLPTREDCFGLVLIEALCSYVPIVASKYADGAYDVIENNVNGRIIDPYNSQEFGEVLEEVLSNKKIQDAYSEASKQKISKFLFENTLHGYINCIKYVLGGDK